MNDQIRMDLLHELVFVVELSPSRSFPLLLPEGSKMRALYHLVRENEFLNDEDASYSLYQCAPSDKRYLMLKRNLISKLSELILISDLGDTETSSVKFHLEQRLTVGEKLLLQNVFHNAERIGKKVRKEAQKEGLSEVHMRALQLLRKVFTLKGDPKAYQQIAAEYRQVQRQVLEEDRWLQEVQAVESVTKYTVAAMPSAVKGISFSWEGETKLNKIKSYLAQYNFLKLKVYQAHHHNAIGEMDEPLTQLEGLVASQITLQTNANELFWRVYRIRFLLSMGHFHAAESLLTDARNRSSFQAFDRFEVEEQWYVYHARRLELAEACEVIDSVLASPQYDRLHELDRNLWYTRAAYLYWYYCASGETESVPLLKKQFAQFNLEDLYQQTSAISKDKTGGNLHVMLLRGLFTLLHAEASDHAFDTGNTLVVYYQRYLKDYPEDRVVLFFKSVAKLLKRQEDAEKVARLDQKLLEGLSDSEVKYDFNEWLPFRKVWQDHLMAG